MSAHACIHAALNLFLPAVCPACRTNDGPLLCSDCQQSMPTLDAPCPNCALPLRQEECSHCHGRGFSAVHQIICKWHYSGLCRDLILASKIHEDRAAIKSLQHLLPLDELMTYDAVCAIPRSPGRRAGPHLANSLAHYVSRQQDIPLKKYLRQTRLPAAQHELPLSMRRHNTSDLFAMRPVKNSWLGKRIGTHQDNSTDIAKHILLVDDLITSGHTISAAAQCLRRSGIQRVDVLCLARAI